MREPLRSIFSIRWTAKNTAGEVVIDDIGLFKDFDTVEEYRQQLKYECDQLAYQFTFTICEHRVIPEI